MEEWGPRPILVVLAHRHNAESLGRAGCCLRLKPLRIEVSIVKDLTTRQS